MMATTFLLSFRNRVLRAFIILALPSSSLLIPGCALVDDGSSELSSFTMSKLKFYTENEEYELVLDENSNPGFDIGVLFENQSSESVVVSAQSTTYPHFSIQRFDDGEWRSWNVRITSFLVQGSFLVRPGDGFEFEIHIGHFALKEVLDVDHSGMYRIGIDIGAISDDGGAAFDDGVPFQRFYSEPYRVVDKR